MILRAVSGLVSHRWVALLWAVALGATSAAAAAPARPPTVPLRLPPPIVYERTVGPDSAVTFRHETHVELAEYRCLGCHPEPFRMLQPTRRVTHQAMASGGSCGQCHDGRQAFGVSDSAACRTCHAGKTAAAVSESTPGGSSPRKLPGPIAFTRGEASPGAVRFRHDTHTRGIACSACHPKLFAMRSTGGRPGGAMHEATACGSCHDGTRSFGAQDAEACTRCHRESGAQP